MNITFFIMNMIPFVYITQYISVITVKVEITKPIKSKLVHILILTYDKEYNPKKQFLKRYLRPSFLKSPSENSIENKQRGYPAQNIDNYFCSTSP